MTTCTHYIGEPGAGKSHRAFEGFNPKTHFLWPNDGEWWDGYEGQDIVIMNDYRGEIPLNKLCTLIDQWPVTVRTRSRQSLPFISKHIIITSVMTLEEMYGCGADANEDMEQLHRRVKTVRVIKNPKNGPGLEVVRGNNNPDPKSKDPLDDVSRHL